MRRHWLLLLSTALLIPLPVAAPAEMVHVPMVRGEVMRDFARITFEWPRSTYLTASQQGKVLTIRFDRRADPDLRRLLKSLSPYVVSARLATDGKTLQLTLDKPYRVRSFVSDTLNGIDILGVDTAAHNRAPAPVVAAAAPAAPAPIAVAPKPATPPKPAAVAQIAPPAKPEPKQDSRKIALAKLAPAAGEEPHAPQQQQSTPAETPVPHAEAAPEVHAAAEKPVLKMLAGQQDGRLVLRFPWKERVGLAAFMRGNYIWMVFTKPIPVDWSSLKESASSFFPTLQQLPDNRVTVLRLRAPEGIGPIISKEENSFEWRVTLSSPPAPPITPLRLEVNTTPPLPAHVFTPALELAEPVVLTDPDIGDALIVVPSYKPGQGIYPPRKFVDFALLNTATGLAIVRQSDDVILAKVRNGLRIGTREGAHLSTGMPQPIAHVADKASQAHADTLFPYEQWKAAEEPSVEAQIQELRQAIVHTDMTEERLRKELRLAQLYMAGGMEVEALGIVQSINRTQHAFYAANRLSAMEGAAQFVLGRYADAAATFASPELEGNEEITCWKGIIDELLGNTQQPYDYLSYNAKYFTHYPAKFRQRLGIVAADRAIIAEKYDLALKIIDTLQSDGLLANIPGYAEFLAARIFYATGKQDDAIKTWEKLAADYKNPFVRAHAEFALITSLMQSHKLEAEAAVPRLERLRLSWRGDALEMNTLSLLADLYIEHEQYSEAMHAWQDMANEFPGTPSAVDAMRRMRDTFVELFDKGKAASLPALTQLALYYDFRELTPGDATGDHITAALVERLVAVDLLSEAANLLEQRMRYYYARDGRSRAGATLASVYLQMQAPERALKALEESVYGDNPADVREERDRLAAQALVMLKHYEDGLALIVNDKTPAAEDIRLRAAWQQKDWVKVIASIEGSLKGRAPSTEAPSSAETEKLVMLALAYRATDDVVQLQYLRDYFGPLLPQGTRKQVFDFLTQADIPVSPATFDAMMKQAQDTKTFLAGYKAGAAAN